MACFSKSSSRDERNDFEGMKSVEKIHEQWDFDWRRSQGAPCRGHSSIVGVQKLAKVVTNGQRRTSAAGQVKTIYVAGLPQDTNEADLMNFFCELSIQSVRLARDKSTGKFRGFAFVDFADEPSFQQALTYHGSQLRSGCRPITVAVAVKKPNEYDHQVPAHPKGRGEGVISAPARGRGIGMIPGGGYAADVRARGRGGDPSFGRRYHESGGIPGGSAAGIPFDSNGSTGHSAEQSQYTEKSCKPANSYAGPSFDSEAGDCHSTYGQRDSAQENGLSLNEKGASLSVVALVSPCEACGHFNHVVACSCPCSCCRKSQASSLTAQKRQPPQGKRLAALMLKFGTTTCRDVFRDIREGTVHNLVRGQCASQRITAEM